MFQKPGLREKEVSESKEVRIEGITCLESFGESLSFCLYFG